MVKVTKVAAWKIGTEYIEDAKSAEQRVRQLVVEELLEEQHPEADRTLPDTEDLAEWVAFNWDELESRVKKAMAGT